MVTASHYSAAHDSELNKVFVRDFEASTGGKLRVGFAAVAAYNTMAAIYQLAEAQGGRLDAEKTAELVKGFKLDSPRGPIEIDGSRDIVQTISMYVIVEVQRSAPAPVLANRVIFC